MANGIDPRRLVSHEGDIEEATREYEASKKTAASSKTDAKPTAVSYPGDIDDAAKAYADDRSKTASGVSYAEYAKNARSAPACTSDRRENCPNDGPATTPTVTRIEQKGARGVEITLDHPSRKDADVKVGTLKAEVGTQNELSVTVASKETTLGKTGDVTWKASGEVGHAGVHGGVHNSDGSTGVNLGGGAAAGSFAITAEHKDGTKITVGLEAGESVGGSFGFKDRADGKADACLQASIGPVQVGFCTPTSLPGITHRN